MSPAGLEPVLVKGRLSVTGLSINPNFSLEQVDAAQQRLNISGAFGLGAIEVLYFKGTVQRGLVDATGLDVPLSVVPAWMLGQPHSRYRSQRTATGFEQLGWRIAVSQDDALGRPRRIEAVKGETKVILGIKLWQ